MATTTLPTLVSQAINGKRIWLYESTDAAATVDASAYFTNGYKAGMRKGDIVFVLDTDSTYQQVTSHVVVSDTSGVIDLSDGVSIGGAANAD